MRKQAGILFAAVLYYSGLVGLARWLMQKRERHLIILTYHRASGGDLSHHLLYLRRHYRILHLEEALEELFQPEIHKQKRRDQRTPLVVTFDDGYQDMYTHAFALARKLQVPITIFLVPGYLEGKERFWWEEGNYLAQHARGEQVIATGETYQLTEPAERRRLASSIDYSLRHAHSVAEREGLLNTWRDTTVDPSSEHVDRCTVNWDEIVEMEQSGLVSFGAHTMHHPILAYLDDPVELEYEVNECRHVLEQKLGHTVHIFAYPVGKAEQVSVAAVQAVKEAGYRWAVTTEPGINTSASDPYRLRRLSSGISLHWLIMAARVSGLWSLLSPVWKAMIGEGKEL